MARGHRLAAPYAAAVGLSVAIGFVAVHLAPHWSAVSDPYSAWRPDALSWALVALPIAAAVNLVAQAVRVGARPPRGADARARAGAGDQRGSYV